MCEILNDFHLILDAQNPYYPKSYPQFKGFKFFQSGDSSYRNVDFQWSTTGK